MPVKTRVKKKEVKNKVTAPFFATEAIDFAPLSSISRSTSYGKQLIFFTFVNIETLKMRFITDY